MEVQTVGYIIGLLVGISSGFTWGMKYGYNKATKGERKFDKSVKIAKKTGRY